MSPRRGDDDSAYVEDGPPPPPTDDDVVRRDDRDDGGTDDGESVTAAASPPDARAVSDAGDNDGDDVDGDGDPAASDPAADDAAVDVPAAVSDPAAEPPANNNDDAAAPSGHERGHEHDREPSYEYPANRAYYPTYPANGATLARLDSDLYGTTTSDDEDDDEDDEDANIGDVDMSALGSSGASMVLESSMADITRSDDEGEEEEDDDPPLRRHTASLAASAPSLLTGLPETHRPFRSTVAAPAKTDYSYLSTQPFYGAEHNDPQAFMSKYSPKPAGIKSVNLHAGLPPPLQPTTDVEPMAKSPPPTQNDNLEKLYGSLPVIPLSSLPIDALHATSSYCTPRDWASLSGASKVWRGIGREVFEKVWRHAGRCMVEVGVAWARGEHADARELASLYVSKGVPVYPAPHGHSYHTLAWRMKLELENTAADADENGEGGDGAAANAAGGANDAANNNNAAGGANAAGGNRGAAAGGAADDATDPFYEERYVENGPTGGNGNGNHRDFFSRNRLTYVEEKATFWKQKKGIETSPPANGAPPPLFPPPQARASLFPRFRNNDGGVLARGPPLAVAPPPQAAGMGGVGGAGVLTGAGGVGGGVDDAGGMGGGFGGGAMAATGVAGGGIGLARPPPLPARGGSGGGAAPTQPIGFAAGAGGGGAAAAGRAAMGMARGASARAESLADAQLDLLRNFGGGAGATSVTTVSHTAGPRSTGTTTTMTTAAPAITPPRHGYVRRSSFSGTGSFTDRPLPNFPMTNSTSSSPLGARNPSAPSLASRGISASLSASDGSARNADWGAAAAPVLPPAPRMTMRIHRHLADQHLFGSPAANDENGTMTAGKLSMNADFFHPTWDGGRNKNGYATVAPVAPVRSNVVEDWDGYWDGAGWRTGAADHLTTAATHPDLIAQDEATGAGLEAAANDIGETVVANPPRDAANADRNPLMENSSYRDAVRAFVTWTLANAGGGGGDRNGNRRNSLPGNARSGRLHALLGDPSTWGRLDGGPSNLASSPAADVHLEVYSSSSAGLKSENEEENKAVSKMLERAELYRNRLNSLLKSGGASNSKFDTFAFQECLLDFWDELFPTTAGIHFFNQQSPVPRMTHLHSFLTTPCPKAVGTIQCEIERVKVSSKRKGAKGVTKGMKGKFFPSYEYRLFVRDTKNDNPFHSGRAPPRKDTVLLVAKNKSGSGKGKNVSNSMDRAGSGVGGLDFAGAASPASASKRGVTNYYMCLPNQADVDGHYTSANRNNPNATLHAGEKCGLAVSPMAAAANGGGGKGGGGSMEVGRLQSNFIGTEFQIFVPNKSVLNSRNLEERRRATSEDGPGVHPIETASAVAASAVDAPAPGRKKGRRGSGLKRMVRRASSTLSRRGSSGALGRDGGGGDPTEEENGESPLRGSFSKKASRRMSWGSGPNVAGGRHHRTSRRAIANNYEAFEDDDLRASSSSMREVANAVNGGGEVENGAITYTANLLGNRPRIMDVCIPKLTEDGRVAEEWSGEQRDGVPSSNGGGGGANTMLDRFKTIQQGLENLEDGLAPNDDVGDAPNDNNATNTAADDHRLMILQNRPPWWNIELGAFVLNFGGRVKVASVKNFQLCERNDTDHVMQFGRIEGRHAFTMDFQHPLTPMQAFAIAISSLQSKISFG